MQFMINAERDVSYCDTWQSWRTYP